VIHEEQEVPYRVEEKYRPPVEERPSDDMVLRLPQQTYTHMIGRSFGVAFNDRSFLRPETASNASDRYYYGSLGTYRVQKDLDCNCTLYKVFGAIVLRRLTDELSST